MQKLASVWATLSLTTVIFELQRCLFQQKARDYWSTAVAVTDCNIRFTSTVVKAQEYIVAAGFSRVLTPCCRPLFDALYVEDPGSIRNSTAGVIHYRHLSSQATATAPLSSLSPVTVQEDIKLSANYRRNIDSVPTWLVKRLTEHIAPVNCQLCNASLQSASQPETYRRSATAQETDAE